MSTEASAALIGTIVGAVIGGLVSFLCTFFTLRYNYRQLFAETVSKNRMEWINVWRENLSTYLAINDEIRKKDNDVGNKTEKLIELNHAKYMITTRLNMHESKHKALYCLINLFSYDMDDDEYKKKKMAIEETARCILKEEWERVKEEARGKERK